MWGASVVSRESGERIGLVVLVVTVAGILLVAYLGIEWPHS